MAQTRIRNDKCNQILSCTLNPGIKIISENTRNSILIELTFLFTYFKVGSTCNLKMVILGLRHAFTIYNEMYKNTSQFFLLKKLLFGSEVLFWFLFSYLSIWIDSKSIEIYIFLKFKHIFLPFMIWKNYQLNKNTLKTLNALQHNFISF